VSRVAVLKGGRSLERSVSLRSGARVEDALARLGHEVVGIDVGPDLVARLREAAPDVAFIAVHGRDGEDGTIQEVLEVLGIPYTGSGVSSCMRCADKILAKYAFVDAGLPTPDFFAFSQAAFKELGAGDALSAIEDRLAFPLVVKPARMGSALGIKYARAAADVPTALVSAFSYDHKVLLERFVDGRDIAVSVLDGAPLPVVEAVPEADPSADGEGEGPRYDFSARYDIGRTRFVCPAELPAQVAERAQELAVAAYEVLGCRGFARVDLLCDRATDELWLLEVNPVPGLTETSLLPLAADAAGIPFDAFVARVVDLALAARA
jgi:D-alanine-D-alanine ligase